MKTAFVFLLIVIASICFAAVVRAQSKPDATEAAQDLKLQLIEIAAKEEIAKVQAQQLDELLKPENIERSLAGIGSTKPEELREQRRRQLMMEKTVVVAQLEQLRLRRSRLESALAATEAQAYQQSAKSEPQINNALGVGVEKAGWWVAILLVAVVSVLSLMAGALVLRNYVNRLATMI
jgi:hypothetical protein